MPTYTIQIGNDAYDIEAPEEKLSSIVAQLKAHQQAAQQVPESGSMVDEFGGSSGTSVVDRLKGLPAAMTEAFTGASRQTEATRTTPDYRAGNSITGEGAMPEMQDTGYFKESKFGERAPLIPPSVQAAFGSLASGPEETAKIIKAQFPNVQVFNDEKGNFFLKSAVDGKTYAIKPGFNAGDILRGIGTVGQYMIGGEVAGAAKGLKTGYAAANTLRKVGLAERAAGSAIGQTIVESGQAATGGEFNAETIPEAAAADIALAGAGKAIGGAKRIISPSAGKLGALESGGFGVGGGEGASIPASEVAGAAERMAMKDPVQALRADPDFNAIVRGVTKNDPAAIEKFSQYIEADPAGLAAARELGIDLPADVFSANKQLKAAMGLARAQIASPEQAAFLTAKEGASQKLATAIEQLGGKDISTLSSDVLDSLKASRDDLSERAATAYDQIPIPKSTKVDAENIIGYLDGIIGERAGNEGVLSGIEKKIYQEAKQGKLTFARLKDFKGELRLMESGRTGEYATLADARRRGLADALKADEFATANKVGGAEGHASLTEGNSLYAQKKALDEKIVKGFGQAENGSISDILKTSITKGTGGSVKKLNEVLAIVPEELHKDTLLTGLLDASKTKLAGGDYALDPSRFVKTFRGIMQQKEVAKTFAQKIGKEGMDKLQKVYAVSKAITDIIPTPSTGASLQASELFKPTGLIGKMADKATGPVQAATFGTMVGGPIGEFLGIGHQMGQVIGGLAGGGVGMLGKKAIDERGAKFLGVLSSPEFKSLAIKAATQPKVSNTDINKLIFSKQFRQFAKATGMDMSKKALTAWVVDSLQPKTKE